MRHTRFEQIFLFNQKLMHGTFALPAFAKKTLRSKYRLPHNSVGCRGCWTWKGAPDRDGFGIYQFAKHRWYAHYAVWASVHGSLPRKLNKTCGNKLCVNPNHHQTI